MKKLEFVLILIFAFSFLYVPTVICSGDAAYRCGSESWEWIFDSQRNRFVDYSRLFIQEVIIAILLFAIWRMKRVNGDD